MQRSHALRIDRRPALVPILLAAVACLAASGLSAGAEPWPYMPFDQPHGLGNHYGEFQDYGGGGYYHDGIDLVTPGGPEETYSVSAGTLTHLTYNDPLYSGLMIGEPVANGEGWLYWHISSTTMQFDVGDRVEINDYIGTTASWPVSSFHHVHFNQVEGTGGYPWGWYLSIGNPLEFMEPHPDDDPPVFELAYASRPFGFAAQSNGAVLNADALSGSVDIIAKVGDIVGLSQWRLNPWKIEYWIDGATQSIAPTNSVTFTGTIPNAGTESVIYRTLTPMKTRANYDYRDFYFIVTNTDGDGFVESTDAAAYWNTAAFGPGDYWVYVRAHDLGGNAVTDSMRATVAGTVSPDVFLPETSHDFGFVPPGGSQDWEMAVRNLGTDPLSVRTVAISSARFTADRSHFFVLPGEEEIVRVTFSPLQTQAYTATLEMTTNDPDEPFLQVPLQGEGADPSIAPDPAGNGALATEALRILAARTLPGIGLELRFALPRASEVSAAVHGIDGRLLRADRLGSLAAGSRGWTWDGRDDAGMRLPSGVYYVRLSAGPWTEHRAGLLLK